MARECGWCGHPSRATWERRVASGESLAIVAASTPFSVAAAHRHVRAHLQAAVLAELSTSSDVRVTDFVDRLIDLSSQAAEVRRYAAATHQPRLVLSAIHEEASLIGQVLNRLGVDSEETLSMLRDTEALARAVSGLIADGVMPPQAAAQLASRIDDLGGSPELAGAFAAANRYVSLVKEPS